ncbi:MAG: magnesium transporter, partial [Ureaplasma sp.]|nr:magnesium transporter [Ureaplasma sp.]
INESLIEIDNPEVILFLLMVINKNKTSAVYRYLPDELQDKIVEIATNNQIKIIFSNLFPDEIVDIANRNKDSFKKILLNLSTEQRSMVKKIDKFENDEAGSIMNPEFINFDENWTIKKCLQVIKNINKTKNIEEYESVFVCKSDGYLLGFVNIQDLFFADNYNKKIIDILNDSFISAKANDDIENIIDIFQEYHFKHIPIVNEKNQLIGLINNNDILPAIEEEVTEDIYNMYGIQKIDESYIHSSIWKIVKSRLFWVTILMISATLTSILITLFEQWGIKATAGLSTILLIPILPVITGTSGNTGSQAFATTIRTLAVGEATNKEYSKLIFKEFRIAIILGFLLGFINFIRLLIYFSIPQFRLLNTNTGQHIEIEYYKTVFVAIGVSVALWVAIIFAKLLGVCLPLLAIKFKLDPTIMCGPLIATLLDITSTSLLFLIGIAILSLIA